MQGKVLFMDLQWAAYCILCIGCAIFAQVGTFFCQCAIYGQDYLPNAQYMHKITLLSPMRNICARFAQDCTSFLNVQYMEKIAGIIGKNMSHITYLLWIRNGIHSIVIFGLPQALTSFCTTTYDDTGQKHVPYY